MEKIAELLFEHVYSRKPNANDAREIANIMLDLDYAKDNMEMRTEMGNK